MSKKRSLLSSSASPNWGCLATALSNVRGCKSFTVDDLPCRAALSSPTEIERRLPTSSEEEYLFVNQLLYNYKLFNGIPLQSNSSSFLIVMEDIGSHIYGNDLIPCYRFHCSHAKGIQVGLYNIIILNLIYLINFHIRIYLFLIFVVEMDIPVFVRNIGITPLTIRETEIS